MRRYGEFEDTLSVRDAVFSMRPILTNVEILLGMIKILHNQE